MENKFGLWTVIKDEKIHRDNRVYFLCRCDCGTEKEVIIKNLRSGQSTSCGCIGRAKVTERNKTHGLRFTRTWRIWQAMKNRCHNPNTVQYKNYGGRGIKVCDEWRKDFMAFYNYVGEAPAGKSIDRIDNNGNYEPGNVQWSTAREQGKNKTTNRKINGKCISEISRSLGGNHGLVYKRLQRGWDLERAITEPSHASV